MDPGKSKQKNVAMHGCRYRCTSVWKAHRNKQLPVWMLPLWCHKPCSMEAQNLKNKNLTQLTINTFPKPFSRAGMRWKQSPCDDCSGLSRNPGKTLVHSRTQLNPCARCGVLCRMLEHSLSVKNISCICSLNPRRTSTCIPDFMIVYDLLLRFYNVELEFSQHTSSKRKL